jgi:uncharacterized membrane protein YfcA
MGSAGQVALVLSVLFLTTFTRSALGFGDALLAMPLLTLIVGIQTATPLVALVATTISLAILVESWRSVDLRASWRLVLSSVLGIPLGLWLLRAVPESIVKGALGVLLIGFGLYQLIRPRLPALQQQWPAYLFGLAAGVLGGAYNTNGPPVIIYGTLRRWSPKRFRATLQSYFFPTGLFILAGHGLGGLWTRGILRLYLYSLPVLLLAVLVGARVNRLISVEKFHRIVYAVLIVIGVFLFIY